MSEILCSACAVGLPIGSEKDACTDCNKLFCASCTILKSKLQKTAAVGRKKKCVCQQLISSKSRDLQRAPSSVESVPHKSENDDVTRKHALNGCLSDIGTNRVVTTGSPLKNKNQKKIAAEVVNSVDQGAFPAKHATGMKKEDVKTVNGASRSEDVINEDKSHAMPPEQRHDRLHHEEPHVEKPLAQPSPWPIRERTELPCMHDAHECSHSEEMFEPFMPFYEQILSNAQAQSRSGQAGTEADLASLMLGLMPSHRDSSDEVMNMFPFFDQMLHGDRRPTALPRDAEQVTDIASQVALLHGGRECPLCVRMLTSLMSHKGPMKHSDRSASEWSHSYPSRQNSLSKLEDDICNTTMDNFDDIPPLYELSPILAASGAYDPNYLKVAIHKQIQKNMLESTKRREPLDHEEYSSSTIEKLLKVVEEMNTVEQTASSESARDAETKIGGSKANEVLNTNHEPASVMENTSLLPQEKDVVNTTRDKIEPSLAVEKDNEELDKDLMRRQRLEKFDKKPAFIEPRSKPDNRDIAPNMQPAPRTVKGKAFKHALPIETNNQSDNLFQNGDESTSVFHDVNDQTFAGLPRSSARNKDNSTSKTTIADKTTLPTNTTLPTIDRIDEKPGESNGVEDENTVEDKDIPTAMKAFLISRGKWNPNQGRNVVKQKSPALKSDKKETQPVTSSQQRFGKSIPSMSVNRSILKGTTQPGQPGNEVGSYRSDVRQYSSGTGRQINQLAEIYDRAFNSLKALESEQQACPACGSPDCRKVLGYSKTTLQEQAEFNGLAVVDVPPDGNCMFAAVVDQLQAHDVHEYTTRSLREKAVEWLKDNPKCPDDQDTHFQSFMSEQWDTYLERMARDGQWGDHVTIRAIANVVGCTVKILNVNGKVSFWTIIEPGTETKEVLFLGHIGEFHYTSLRHAAVQERSSFERNVDKPSKPRPLDPQDVKKVVLFKKDYVDRPSGIPICCWNFALNSILSKQHVMTIASGNSSTYLDAINGHKHIPETLARRLPPHTFVTTGCAAQGTFVPFYCRDSPTEDNLFYWTPSYLRIVYERMSEHPLRLEGSGTICYPGFSTIFYDTDISNRFYVCNDNFKHNIRSFSAMFSSPHSPDATLQVQTQIMCVMAWPDWPEVASEWVTRRRYVGWPSSKIIEEITSKGCLMEPVAHIDSANPSLEWRFCFDEANTKLFREGISEHQKYCFLILFALCFRSLNGIESCNIDFITNIFFYCCERCPAEYWQSSPGGCVMFMLDALLRCMKERFLPNYFIPSYNLIECLSTRDINAISDRVLDMRREPLMILRQVQQSGTGIVSDGLFDRVRLEAQRFCSVKESTLNCFVPCTIDFAKYYVNRAVYDVAYGYLVKAYELRQSVSTCEDSMSLHSFALVCFNGIDLNSRVWFATYLDKQLGSSLIRDVCSDLTLIRTDEILPNDIAVSYGISEVPLSFSYNVDCFCHDFAAFLVFLGQDEEALPVLYHCHTLYQHHRSTGDTSLLFCDDAMICVYAGIFALHKKAHETAIFKDLLSIAFLTAERLNEAYGFAWLADVYTEFNDTVGAKACSDEVARPADVNQSKMRHLKMWPMKYIM